MSGQDNISKEIHNFYCNLYKQHPSSTPLVRPNLSKSTPEENYDLDKPITLDELRITLDKSKGTTPGPDGIPNAIYKVTWEITGPVILNSWLFALQTGLLSPSQRNASVCLLEKKGKDKRIINNLRPITLSNCDLKLITKTYTTRINKILSRIISNNQTAYLPGRQVHDGLRLLEILKENHYRSSTGYLISLDAKKAYDSVSHSYIKHVLNERGFSPNFQHVVETLYNQIEIQVMVNGFPSKEIKIGRGVKQGDALSCSLFILVMDQIIYDINNSSITKEVINNSHISNTVAYADDLAVIVTKKDDIQNVLSLYEKFSHESGLFLNADKTEILNLKDWAENETLDVVVYNTPINIKMVKDIKICGKLFSHLPNRESQAIDTQIEKVSKQLDMWSKRNLSTEGRILIAKTFGISQIIYNLQNSYASDDQLKKIESIVYKYIWKGPDKIKRDMVKSDFAIGGLKGPCLQSLDKTLKLKQVARASLSHHDIAIGQACSGLFTNIICHTHTKNKFTLKGIKTYNLIQCNILKEIIQDPYANIHKTHYQMIGNESIKTIGECLKGKNEIRNMLINNECLGLNASKVNILATIRNLPPNIQSIMNMLHPEVLRKIQAHNQPIEDVDLVRKVPIKTNIFRSTDKIKHREIFLTNNDAETIPSLNPFMIARKIQHPRERMTQYLSLHSKTFSNQRLFNFKMIDSDKCKICPDQVEDQDHIFKKCKRATAAWKIYEDATQTRIHEIIIDEGPNDFNHINIFSLVKHSLYYPRDTMIETNSLKARIDLRLSDLRLLNFIKLKKLKNRIDSTSV